MTLALVLGGLLLGWTLLAIPLAVIVGRYLARREAGPPDRGDVDRSSR